MQLSKMDRNICGILSSEDKPKNGLVWVNVLIRHVGICEGIFDLELMAVKMQRWNTEEWSLRSKF